MFQPDDDEGDILRKRGTLNTTGFNRYKIFKIRLQTRKS